MKSVYKKVYKWFGIIYDDDNDGLLKTETFDL